jgi:hypothetical protein
MGTISEYFALGFNAIQVYLRYGSIPSVVIMTDYDEYIPVNY